MRPLTKDRAKPAVPVGGKYRLVDICVSNCLHSGMHHIAILTQFNSVSLNRHIAQTYHFDVFHEGWVQILAAEQTNKISDWYQGTADAVRKHLDEIRSSNARDVLILAGDHLYRMNYSELLSQHRAKRADITVAVKPVAQKDTARFGILKQTSDGRIRTFVEKPTESDQLNQLISTADSDRGYLASMGIYIFQTQVLCKLLDSHFVDFGADVLPAAIESNNVYGHSFDRYWEDIGTIRSYYDANMALLGSTPPFTFDDTVWPIYTRPRFLPGSRLKDVTCNDVLLADGCVVEKAKLHNSLIGNRSIIQPDVVIRNTILMGASYTEPQSEQLTSGIPAMGIGQGCHIEGAILDRNVRVGAHVRIESFPRGTNIDEDTYTIRDGIVVIPHHTVISPGTVIAPDN
jgi:glucose-1-phosphate adenylyltransferase